MTAVKSHWEKIVLMGNVKFVLLASLTLSNL